MTTTNKNLQAEQKFEQFKDSTLYPFLNPTNQEFVKHITTSYALTFQEMRILSEMVRDLEMWNQPDFIKHKWSSLEAQVPLNWDVSQRKTALFNEIQNCVHDLKQKPIQYPAKLEELPQKEPLKFVHAKTENKIFGSCPVASPKTVCCNLKTIDAVQNCIYGCSYCTIQSFYGSEAVFDEDLAEKLKKIELDPNCFYHIGTGQSSDSLVWGNRNGILDHLCQFAEEHANILLEFKTKSNNIAYFLEHKNIPKNLVCSWSLNTDPVIKFEEHFTATLDQRLQAARAVADLGIKVAFHLHPIVYYEDWAKDYMKLAFKVQNLFKPDEVLFLSFGSVTFIKPVVQEIRKRAIKTKILQMDMTPDPHGKLSYPDHVKINLFRTCYDAFRPWQGAVYMYLCMERNFFWEQVLGWHYDSNEEFEQDFGVQIMKKIVISS